MAPLNGSPLRYGKYELLERIGDGGMAEVFRARLPGVAGFEKTVVIKRMLPHLASKPRFVEMFVAEASLAAQVQHKNVVQVFELGQVESGELFIAMEYVEGTDLRRILKQATTQGLRIPPWFSIWLMTEVLDGLSYAHGLADASGRPRNIVHRDVTPSNVFISHLGEVKLGDFGVAHDESRSWQTQAGQLKGKIPYMAPEQLHARSLDARTDVFAAAVVLWECLTQRRLFSGGPDIEVMTRIVSGPRRPASAYAGDVLPELDAVLLAALEAEAAARTPSAAALQGQLLDLLPRYVSGVRTEMVRRVVDVFLGKAAGPAALSAAGIGSLALVKPEGPGSAGPKSRTESVQLFGVGTSTSSQLEHLSDPFYDRRPEAPAMERAASLQAVNAPTALVDDLFLDEAPAPTTGLAAGLLQPLPPPALVTADLEPQPLLLSDEFLAPVEEAGPGPAQGEDDRLEALVNEAVAEVAHLRQVDVAPLPERSVLAGLDVRRHASRVSDFAEQKWASYGLMGQTYEGPHPFWMKDHDGDLIGPMSWEQASGIVRAEMEARLDGSCLISPDEATWVTLGELAALVGLEWLLRDEAAARDSRGLLVGTLDRRSLTSLLGVLDHNRATGVLTVVDRGTRRSDIRELHVVDGAPTYVFADADRLQLPDLLTRKRIVPKALLPELVHSALSARLPLIEVASRHLSTDLGRYRSMFMKERLADLFAWGSGRFSFDEESPPRRAQPFAKSLLALVPELVHRSLGIDRLRAEVLPYLERELKPTSRFSAGVDRLSLTPAQLASASKLSQGKRLSALLTHHPEEAKLHLTMAYVLLEAELLLPA